MDYFPAFIDIRQQPVVIIGGGEVAARKAELVLSAGASVTVVSPRLCASLSRQDISHQADNYSARYLEGARLCFAATDDPAINRQVHSDCEARGILVNVVDSPARCRFITPSVIDRQPLQIAIASGGSAPVLVRLLREKLEAELPEQLGELAEFAGRMRTRVKQALGSLNLRRRLWERFFFGPAQSATTEQAREHCLQQALAEDGSDGELFKLSCSGDPGQITLAQLRMMQQVDAVFYQGPAEPLLSLVRRDAEKHPLAAEGGWAAVGPQVQQRTADGERVLWLQVQ